MVEKSLSVLDAIATRRSTRSFLTIPVPQEDVQAILQAGIQAPSAANRQPWRFFLVYDQLAKLQIAQAMTDSVKGPVSASDQRFTAKEVSSVQHSAFAIKQAPLLVLVYHFSALDPSESYDFYSSDSQSIGACMENMALAAHSLGIASLWLCDVLYAEGEINKVVEVEHRKLMAALALGYRDNDAYHYEAFRRKLQDTIIGVV